jgi:hypothetical protein
VLVAVGVDTAATGARAARPTTHTRTPAARNPVVGAGPSSVNTSTRPNRSGVLSTTVTDRGNGSVLVAFLSISWRPPAGATLAPSAAGVRWSFVSVETAGEGTVGIWQATLHRRQRVRVHVHVPPHAHQALLTVAQFPAGIRIGDTALNGGDRGLPSVRLRAGTGDQVWAVGHATVGTRSLAPVANQQFVANTRKSAHQSWVQTLTVAKAGAATVADTGSNTHGWFLAAAVIVPARP